MSRIYLWSDLHLGDPKIAALRGHTPEEHDALLLDTWAATIRPRDIIYFLGDLSIHNVAGALESVSKLPGRKRIIWGNHDPAHPMYRRSHAHQPLFLDVFETGDSIGFIKHAGVPLLLSHFPYHGDHAPQDRHQAYRLRDQGTPLVHGHVHHLWDTNSHQYNVGVDVRPQPVEVEQVAMWAGSLP